MLNEIPPETQAVFARNWLRYLNAAAERPPNAISVFQSKVRWVAAARSVQYRKISENGRMPVYFAVIDRRSDNELAGYIEFEAQLVSVRLDPTADDLAWARTHAVTGTKREGIWGSTLYAVANCRPIDPFPMWDLRTAKIGGGRLDPDFRRAYALVAEQRNGR